jgi:FKBP-type peptidyl-prolyl cis-trans isomerase FkpA
MMKLFLFLTLQSVAVTSSAQTTAKPKPVAKTATTKPAVKQPVLKNLSDSASYALGVGIANFYQQQVGYFKQQGITNLNTSLTLKALNDVVGGKPALLNDDVANTVLNKLIITVQEEKCRPNIEAGAAFLAKNKTRPGVITTASGLQYEIIKEGTGIKPTNVDTFVCNYRGTLLNGTEFDASYNRGEPLVYPVKDVIRGWTEGLQLMAVGSKYKFYIPHTLGYGTSDNQTIPAGSTLIFEVELLDVKKGK